MPSISAYSLPQNSLFGNGDAKERLTGTARMVHAPVPVDGGDAGRDLEQAGCVMHRQKEGAILK